MEDIKPIIYVLLAVAYFLFQTWRKAFKTNDEATPPDEVPRRGRALPEEEDRLPPPPQQKPTPQRQRPAVPATSFEDILRELQPKAEKAKEQGRATVERAKEVIPPAPQPVYESAPQPVAERKLSKDFTPRVLSWEEAAEQRATARKADRARTALLDTRDKKYALKSKTANNIGEILRDKNSVQQAFILSEVFKRKYD